MKRFSKGAVLFIMNSTQGTLTAQRALALDALRGFAILTMVLSGVIPRGILPEWMYHAQTPPPAHDFIPVPGITWVDLVFPFFLFALGAAIPLAFSKRISRGVSTSRLVLFIIKRGFLLGAFGIYLQHIRPYSINPSPETGTWFAAIGGFLLLFLVWGRFPGKLSAGLKYTIQIAGWLALAIVLYLWEQPDGSTFDLYRSDIIIMILANVAVYGSFIWLFTRKSILLRLGCMGIVMGAVLASGESGWVQSIWTLTSIPGIDPDNVPAWLSWLVEFDWLVKIGTMKYLFIVIPGTIAGDFLLEWMQTLRKEHPQKSLSWDRQRLWLIAGVMVAFIIVLVNGLHTRWVPYTLLSFTVLTGVSLYLVRSSRSWAEQFLKRLVQWGIFWILLGLLFEPYDEGIKKDPVTISYLFVNSGMALFLLASFTIIIDIFRKRWFNLLITNGQNPMVAYVGWANLVQPLLNILGIVVLLDRFFPAVFGPILTEPWAGALQGLLYTFLVALVVHFLTKKKIFLRS